MKRGFGTRLRHLLELLDGDVEQTYRDQGLTSYVPRYTPIVRALEALGPSTLRAISDYAGSSHSAVSQTVSRMREAGLVVMEVGTDGRERLVSMADDLKRQLPRLHSHWATTEAAVVALNSELSQDLLAAVDEATAALHAISFRERIRLQRHQATSPDDSGDDRSSSQGSR